MTRRGIAMTTGVLLVAMAAAITGAGERSAEVALRAAIEAEMVRGDVRGALEQYKRIADTFATSDRPVAAQALLRMADVYRKLGDAEAQKIYLRVLTDFPEQQAAAVARDQVGAAASATAAPMKGDRAVWTGPEVDLFGTVSPDGRFLTYVDWRGNQNLMLRDLVSGTSRPLTGNTPLKNSSSADFSVISRDGAQVAFWMDGLRVASLKGSGIPSSHVVLSNEYLRPMHWSPDNKLIAVLVNDQDLGIVSVENGTLRKLKWTDWRSVDHMAFSPDGRFIAYDVEKPDRIGRRDIMVISVDASREVAIAEDASRNYLMGWSPAGDVVFTSNRTGTRSLWTQRVEIGRAVGEPRMVKANVPATVSLGLTPSGTLYAYQAASPSYVGIARFDVVQGKLLGPGASPVFRKYIERLGSPRWSADGRHLVFRSCGSRNWPCSLFIRDGDAEPREVPHAMLYIQTASLAPDGHAIVASGSDRKGRRGTIFLIDAKTGVTTVVVTLRGPIFPEWSGDGRAIRYSQASGQETLLFDREIGSDQSKEIFRAANGVGRMALSPDGQLVGFFQRRPAGNQPTYTFVVAPLAGGPSRDLFTTSEAPDAGAWQWAPDNQSVILQKGVNEGIELWQLPLSGSPRKLDVDGSLWSSFHVSPDGKQIAFEARTGRAGDEVWALENFLPPSSSKK